jgi:hypothetical protein
MCASIDRSLRAADDDDEKDTVDGTQETGRDTGRDGAGFDTVGLTLKAVRS